MQRDYRKLVRFAAVSFDFLPCALTCKTYFARIVKSKKGLRKKGADMNYIVFDLEWNQCPYGKERENRRLPFEILEMQYPDGVKSDNYYQFFYAKDWSLCNKDEAVYTVIADFAKVSSFEIADIQVITSKQSIYDLSVKKYVTQEDN